jgi:hypothetical protein
MRRDDVLRYAVDSRAVEADVAARPRGASDGFQQRRFARYLARFLPLTIYDLPLKVPPGTVRQIWHRRSDADPASALFQKNHSKRRQDYKSGGTGPNNIGNEHGIERIRSLRPSCDNCRIDEVAAQMTKPSTAKACCK